MNIFDEARSIQGMMSLRDMTQQQLADMLGVSQPYIANKLRLLRFSPKMQEKIIEARISERHARTLLRLDEESAAIALDKIISGDMNTAQTEILVDRMLEEQRRPESLAEYESTEERIAAFEDVIEKSLLGFRLYGTSARSNLERFGGKVYINICIG